MALNPTPRPAGAQPAITPEPGFGAAPLPEVSQPLQPGAGGVVYADGTRMDPVTRARQNARELKPLVFEKGPTDAPAPTLDPFYAKLGGHAVSIDAPPIATAPVPVVRRVKRPTVASATPEDRAPQPQGDIPPVPQQPPQALADPAPGVAAGAVDPLAPVILPVAALSDEDRARMPAASDSDSPAAGVPRAGASRPGKEITGGFGAPAQLQYFALNGKELLTLLDQQLSAIYQRCENDLRFNEGLCYPRVTMRVVVEVRGFVSDNDFTVERLQLPDAPEVTRNPIEFCREVADEVAFVLLEEMRETDDAGASVTPPGQVRAELGLPQPGKRRIKQGAAGSTFVDVVT